MVHAGLLGRERIRRLEDRRLVLEVTLLRMAEAGRLPQLAELVEQLGALPGGGATATAATGPARTGPAATAAVGQAAPAPAPAEPKPTTLRGRLLAACREANSLLARSLEECRVSEPDQDGVVHIEVLGGRKMHRDRLTSEGVQQELREMISKILGQPATLAVTLADAAAAEAGAKPARNAPKPPRPGPAVRKVQKRFDGRVLRVNDQDFEPENEQPDQQPE